MSDNCTFNIGRPNAQHKAIMIKTQANGAIPYFVPFCDMIFKAATAFPNTICTKPMMIDNVIRLSLFTK